MKPPIRMAVATCLAAATTLPAAAASGAPLLGQESVYADVGIDTAGVQSWAGYEQFFPWPATPFVLTRGSSNAVHGAPSNPVSGGTVSPPQLDSSNELVAANTPLNLLDPADAQSWDTKSFAYAMGNGPSFSVGAAATEWNQRATANYNYVFDHVNDTTQTETLSPISLHVEPGRLFLIPRVAPGGDFGSQYRALEAMFTHSLDVVVFDPKSGPQWPAPKVKGDGYSLAAISLQGPHTFGRGLALTFPPGLNQLENGIAVQNIPEQTLTVPQFDLLPGQRLSVSVSMSVSVFAQGTGPAPIFYALAGDPLSVTAGNAVPQVLLEYAAQPVPEPGTGLLLLAGMAGLLLRARRADNARRCGGKGRSRIDNREAYELRQSAKKFDNTPGLCAGVEKSMVMLRPVTRQIAVARATTRPGPGVQPPRCA